MKQKILFCTIAIILLFGIAIPKETLAISSSGGYLIEAYNIDMTVNENNTFDITETIKVKFTANNKHGIFRKIPLTNKITRLDGTTSRNRAKISNISVNDKYTTSVEDSYKVLKIGNENQTISGEKTYVVKYNYNIGKDPLKNGDELYYNLIGNEWDTSIQNINFTITMPKDFDKSKLGFSAGYKTSTDSSKVIYNVTGNKITGVVINSLSPAQALTVRMNLPEGYFIGASNNYDIFMLIEIGISIILVIIAFIIWNKYGKNKMVVETVEFYPPDNLNSADIGFLYKGHSNKKDIISLLVYLANKGYLRIEEYETSALKFIKTKSYKIIKVKDYDGKNKDESKFFHGLFKNKKIVTKNDLYDKFYLTLNDISDNINRKENQEKIFEKASLCKRSILITMIIIIFAFMNCLQEPTNVLANIVFWFFLIDPLLRLYDKPSTTNIIISSVVFELIGLYCMSSDIFLDNIYLVKFLIESICLVSIIILLGTIRKRTEYGNEMLGKIKGFRRFLKTAEKPKLEELVEQDPKYFYKILPYTYVLGVSSKWMKKFEDIALKSPSWYCGYTEFNYYSFNSFMNSTYSSISTAMTSTPSESGSSGGFSGGGFSGGGSGGGGGGSW